MLRKLFKKCLLECFLIFVKAKNLYDEDGYIDAVTIRLNYPKFAKILQCHGLMIKDKDFRCLLRIGEYTNDYID